jgi:hypothetical protein
MKVSIVRSALLAAFIIVVAGCTKLPSDEVCKKLAARASGVTPDEIVITQKPRRIPVVKTITFDGQDKCELENYSRIWIPKVDAFRYVDFGYNRKGKANNEMNWRGILVYIGDLNPTNEWMVERIPGLPKDSDR